MNFETLRIGIGVAGIEFLAHDDMLGRGRLMRGIAQLFGNAVAIRRAVHLLGADFLANFAKNQRNLAYTAVTRAKTSLSIYYERNIPGYLRKGISSIDGHEPELPKLDDLFKAPGQR